MTVSVVLDVIIGLLVVYFIASSMASVINEAVSALFSRRSNNMAQFIVEMLNESTAEGKHPIAEKFYASSVFKFNKINGILGVITSIGQQFPIGKPIVKQSGNILFIPGSSFSQAVFYMLEFTKNANLTVDEIEGALDKIPHGPLKDALKTALQQAGNEVKDVTANLEQWFDSQMTQLSEAYKRQQRFWLFMIGLLVAVVFGVDSISIFNALQNNPALREVLVAQASTLQAPESGAGSQAASDDLAQYLETFEALKAQLSEIGLPIGFNQWAVPEGVDGGGYILSKIVGVLITSIAISLGAPFWYDVLKSLSGRSPSVKS